VLISRLSEIENKGLVPGIYKLYALSAAYCLDFAAAGRCLVRRRFPHARRRLLRPHHGDVTVPLPGQILRRARERINLLALETL
jgi:hypothetical protein